MTIPSAGLATFMSAHRSRLTIGACILAITLMMTLVYATVGFGPPWGSPASLPT